ncbi:MAG: HlyD family secretion protein [Verrucomicrobiota bacterium]
MENLPPIPSPPGTAFREFRVNVLPALAFLVVLGFTVWLWRNQVGPANLVGEVEMRRAVLTSVQPGRVMRVLVEPLQAVTNSQPVVEMVPADLKFLEAQASLGQARLDQIRLAVDPKIRRENNRINFTQLRLDWLSERVDLAAAEARLAYYEAEHDRRLRLYTASLRGTNGFGVTSEADLQIAQRDLDALRAEIVQRRLLVEEISETIGTLEPEDRRIDEQLPKAVAMALEAEERALALVNEQLKPVLLTSPMDGFVSAIHRLPGENAVAGEPLVTISASRAQHIVAYLRQPVEEVPAADQGVEVRTRSVRREAAVGRVVRVGRQLEPILPELLPPRPSSSAAPEYGLPLLVSLPEGLTALPGEIVDLRLVPR